MAHPQPWRAQSICQTFYALRGLARRCAIARRGTGVPFSWRLWAQWLGYNSGVYPLPYLCVPLRAACLPQVCFYSSDARHVAAVHARPPQNCRGIAHVSGREVVTPLQLNPVHFCGRERLRGHITASASSRACHHTRAHRAGSNPHPVGACPCQLPCSTAMPSSDAPTGASQAVPHFVAGALGGSVASFLLSPLDILRTRLQ
ncbi:MAG: hypothetical protein EOO65_02215, partial [Methanosarcinales archaeon]